MNLETPEHISKLLFKYITGALNEEEERELEVWRREKEQHEILFRRMTSPDYLKNIGNFVLPEAEKKKEWEVIRRKTIKKGRTFRGSIFWQYAAMLLLPLAVCILLLRQGEQPDGLPEPPLTLSGDKATLVLEDGRVIDLDEVGGQKIALDELSHLEKSGDTLHYKTKNIASEDTVQRYNTLYIPRGADYFLVLNDGTAVYLNAESSLRYPIAFKGKKREVELQGEGFFEVKKDPAHPFIVHVNKVQVSVLGTSFGIRAYQNDKEMLTTLIEGSVNVRTPYREVLLKPSQQAVYSSESEEIEVRTVDVDRYVAWKNGRFLFDNARLEDIMNVLERRYDFTVFYSHPDLKELRFTANIVRFADFQRILHSLEGTESVRFEVKGKTVVVK